jgi:hypothetical protein
MQVNVRHQELGSLYFEKMQGTLDVQDQLKP